MRGLEATDPPGTEGVHRGKPAVRVDLGGRPYAVALHNEGAALKTDGGRRFTFREALEAFPAVAADSGDPYAWRLPDGEEARALTLLPGTWRTRGGTKGMEIAVAEGASLFLPAAGFAVDGGTVHGEGLAALLRTSTACGDELADALYATADFVGVCRSRRTLGACVRPFARLGGED